MSLVILWEHSVFWETVFVPKSSAWYLRACHPLLGDASVGAGQGAGFVVGRGSLSYRRFTGRGYERKAPTSLVDRCIRTFVEVLSWLAAGATRNKKLNSAA